FLESIRNGRRRPWMTGTGRDRRSLPHTSVRPAPLHLAWTSEAARARPGAPTTKGTSATCRVAPPVPHKPATLRRPPRAASDVRRSARVRGLQSCAASCGPLLSQSLAKCPEGSLQVVTLALHQLAGRQYRAHFLGQQ